MRKLTIEVDGGYRIRSDPPVLVPLEEVAPQWPGEFAATWDAEEMHEVLLGVLADYRSTLPDHRVALLDRFLLVDGLVVEGVYMPSGERSTFCISSQAGCAMACGSRRARASCGSAARSCPPAPR